MYYLDTETVGLHGIAVLIQWAKDDGPIVLHHVFKVPASETLSLIEEFCTDTVCGFNLAFDWFHINKLYNVLLKAVDKRRGEDFYPEDEIDLIASVEKDARDGLCIKPKKSLDLMLHARKGPYQSTMDRKDIRIRRVPAPLAQPLCEELDQRIKFPDIYFERRQDKTVRWQVQDIDEDYDFKNVVLKFINVDPPSFKKVTEYGYAPFHEAVKEGKPWPIWIKGDIAHWFHYKRATQYAEDDIKYTRWIHKYFSTNDREYALSEQYDASRHLEGGDVDSELACCVGAVRWKGYALNLDGVQGLRKQALEISKSAPKAPNQVRAWLYEVMDEIQQLTLAESTGIVILEEIATWEGTEAAKRASAVIAARKAKKEVELYDKLLLAGRFHASFKVIGTKSNRMSGADGLNPQGIDHRELVRQQFVLAFKAFMLSGGDFSSFENNIAAADYNDPELTKLLQSGKKLQGLIGEAIYEDMNYDEILASSGSEDDRYSDSKRANYAYLYGGDEKTWETRIGISEDVGAQAIARLNKRFPGIERARKKIHDSFCSMRQPGGIGTQVIWHEPADYIESLLGFKRYFTLENKICKTLFEIANDPPKEWHKIKLKVVRRDRMQTASGATQSALYGAAFQIQAANLRAAANHRIQSTGGEITKNVQKAIWDLQPQGAFEWFVMPMNIHDEIMTTHKKGLENKIENVVQETVNGYKDLIPLIKIDWQKGLASWQH